MDEGTAIAITTCRRQGVDRGVSFLCRYLSASTSRRPLGVSCHTNGTVGSHSGLSRRARPGG